MRIIQRVSWGERVRAATVAIVSRRPGSMVSDVGANKTR
jgi:hypothetical protein